MQQEPNFAQLIEQAQSVTSDVAGPFDGSNVARVGFQGRVPNVPILNYEAKVRVFTLPGDSGEYEEVLNMMLRGEAIARFEERTFSKEGDFLVAVCYIVPLAPRPDRVAAGNAGDREPVAGHQRLA